MPDRMDRTDHVAAKRALVGWFEAQRIDPLHACELMASMIGEIVAKLSTNDPVSRKEALCILTREMETVANDY